MASRSTRLRRPPAKRQQQQQQQPEPQARAKWTPSLTKILADLMVDQVYKGNRPKKFFGKKAWKNICEEFYQKTGRKWDKEQLKNRYAVLRKQFAITKSILDDSDFEWDEPTGVVVATDEAWSRYIQVHPDAENVRSSGCPIYKQLCTIFLEQVTNGSDNQEVGTPGAIACSQPFSLQESSSSSESDEMADEQDRFQPSIHFRDAGRKRGRRGIDDVIAHALSEMATASKLRADAMKKRNERFSIADSVKALDEIQGVDEQVYLAALDLFNNRNVREIFLSLKVHMRLPWLQNKCSNSNSYC